MISDMMVVAYATLNVPSDSLPSEAFAPSTSSYDGQHKATLERTYRQLEEKMAELAEKAEAYEEMALGLRGKEDQSQLPKLILSDEDLEDREKWAEVQDRTAETCTCEAPPALRLTSEDDGLVLLQNQLTEVRRDSTKELQQKLDQTELMIEMRTRLDSERQQRAAERIESMTCKLS